MQPTVIYLLSTTFNYDLIISGDAGASFAADYGWQTATMKDLGERQYDIIIIDHRFPPGEIQDLKVWLASTNAIVVLRVCDPIWEHCRDHWWYRFVFEMIDQPRVHVMLNYQPAETSALLFARSRRSQFIFAPYVYRKEMEHPLEYARRAHRILLSGRRDATVYPLRSAMARVAYWWMPLRLFCTTLEHPGYPDLGQGRRHDIVGPKYLELLASHRFAGVCSSRCKIELLKYRELAYAGVVPVGDMPATLLDCPADAWVPWRRNFIALTRTLRSMDDAERRADKFRQFMRERRDANAMRDIVARQVGRLI